MRRPGGREDRKRPSLAPGMAPRLSLEPPLPGDRYLENVVEVEQAS
jgi:hypothetical protein